ncbi:hypothetical protein HJG54_07510 [Leptolyngbya sp. NK1-12]|uniref:Uncharacterized protein n=1 Tax=Leptolyngbya sp. NK1-12 TaxID=2547451 RepID=A0AA96WAC3_9CYAN|nr:hypothetical protein [Leptolyngbya sp. NK1-12]WNZ22717.1 hypothetical protein HJG54_07510 [Leptolyngbya sp. NK1-12]
MIQTLNGNGHIRNPRAYALKILEHDKQHWEDAFSQWQQRAAQTPIPPPSPDQNFDERKSLIGLLQLKQQQGQPISLALKKRAAQLGINLEDPHP